MRNIRQDANNQIKNGEFTEDEKKSLENDVQDLINKYNKQVEEINANKEKELMAI